MRLPLAAMKLGLPSLSSPSPPLPPPSTFQAASRRAIIGLTERFLSPLPATAPAVDACTVAVPKRFGIGAPLLLVDPRPAPLLERRRGAEAFSAGRKLEEAFFFKLPGPPGAPIPPLAAAAAVALPWFAPAAALARSCAVAGKAPTSFNGTLPWNDGARFIMGELAWGSLPLALPLLLPLAPRVTPARLLITLVALCSTGVALLAPLSLLLPRSPPAPRCGVWCRLPDALDLAEEEEEEVAAGPTAVALETAAPAGCPLPLPPLPAVVLLASVLGARRLGLSLRGGFHWDLPVAWLNQ